MAYIRQNGLPLALAAAVALVTMATALTRGLHPVQAPASPSISIQDDRFYLDGEPFQIISGAIHYFRVHPDLWGDRLVRLRAMGLNTVEVYVPW